MVLIDRFSLLLARANIVTLYEDFPEDFHEAKEGRKGSTFWT